jgi:hypothetical protein
MPIPSSPHALAVLFALLLAACPAKEEADDSSPDADADADTDADTDADADSDTDADADPHVFEVAWFGIEMKFGLQGGEFATVELDREDVPPRMTVALYEEDFTTDWDERYACYVDFDLNGYSAGEEEPTAWFNWLLDFSFAGTTCEGLDPDEFGDDVGAWFEDIDLEIAVSAVDDNLEGALERSFRDYDKYAQYFVGVNLYQDGQILSDNGGQYFFGLVNPLDDGEVDLYELLLGKDIASLPDGYYWIGCTVIWGWM